MLWVQSSGTKLPRSHTVDTFAAEAPLSLGIQDRRFAGNVRGRAAHSNDGVAGGA